MDSVHAKSSQVSFFTNAKGEGREKKNLKVVYCLLSVHESVARIPCRKGVGRKKRIKKKEGRKEKKRKVKKEMKERKRKGRKEKKKIKRNGRKEREGRK